MIIKIRLEWWYDKNAKQHKLIGKFPIAKGCLAIIDEIDGEFFGSAISTPNTTIEDKTLDGLKKKLEDDLRKAYLKEGER